MILVNNNSPKQSFILILLTILSLTGCGTAFVVSKQDDILTQIDVWSAENEFGKAFTTLNYVKESHPQYQQLQIRKKLLLIEAREYEQRIDKQIEQYTKHRQWADALDLLDQANEKYPLEETKKTNRLLVKTEKKLFKEQLTLLASIDQSIMLRRSLWMIEGRPLYEEKLNTDPRNDILKKQLEQLNKEASELAQKLTLLSQQAIQKKYYITAHTRITQAIALEPSTQREKILSQLKRQSRKSTQNKKQKKINRQKKLKKKQYSTLLQDIEKSYNAGDFLNTRQLISQVDEAKQQDTQLIQLKQELDRSINFTIKQLMSEANKNYTDGDFHQAIHLWEQILLYEPENILAKKNIQRAEKVIEKLLHLKEKQKN